jgi:hypothetical protein
VSGLGISNNGSDVAHDIDVAAGIARNSDNTATLSLSAVLRKAIDSVWAVGDDTGGLDTGSVGNATWYYVHLIQRSDTGVVDALFSTSSSSPTLPTNYDKRQLIGAVLTDSSANIIAFTQLAAGNWREYLWADPPLDIDTTQDTSANSHTLSVPTSYQVEANVNCFFTTNNLYLSSLDANDEAPSESAGPLVTIHTGTTGNNVKVRTSSAGQVRARSDGGATALRIATLGWVESVGGT